jgi:hypothetical protein
MQNITTKIFIFGFLLCVLVFLAGLGYYLMQKTSEAQLQRNFEFMPNSGTMATELPSTLNGPVLADLHLYEPGMDRRHFFGLFIDKAEGGDKLTFMRSKDGQLFEDGVELMEIPDLDSIPLSAIMPKLLYNEDASQWEAYIIWPGSKLYSFSSEDGEEWSKSSIETLLSDVLSVSSLMHLQGLGYFAFTPGLKGVELRRGEDIPKLMKSDPRMLEIPIPADHQPGLIRAIYDGGYYYLLIDMLPVAQPAPQTLLARSVDLVSWQVFDDLDGLARAQISSNEMLLSHIDLLSWKGTAILYYNYLSEDWSKEHKGFVKIELATLFSRYYD